MDGLCLQELKELWGAQDRTGGQLETEIGLKQSWANNIPFCASVSPLGKWLEPRLIWL